VIDVHVVVDVANVAFSCAKAVQRLGGAKQNRLQPDLQAVAAVLEHFHFNVVSFDVAVDTTAVEVLGVPAKESARRRNSQASRRWIAAQQDRLGAAKVRELPGATDGNGEIGVDGLAVLAAIQAGWQREVTAIIVLSGDADVSIAQSYVADRPLYVAGWFPTRARARLDDLGCNWIDLGVDGLAAMAPQHLPPDDRQLPAIEFRAEGGGWRLFSGATPRSSDLNTSNRDWLAERQRAVQGVKTVAIVDSYGLQIAAARAIGAAQLPTPGSVAAVVSELQWPTPLAQLAAIPDVTRHVRNMLAQDPQWLAAVVERDRDLDEGYRAYLCDQDDRTHATRGELRPLRDDAAGGYRRALEEKRVTSILAADVLWALTYTDLQVVVLTDRAELVYLLTQLHALGVEHTGRLTRIGLHARPVKIVPAEVEDAGPLGGDAARQLLALRDQLAEPDPPQQVVLNGHLVAELVRLETRLYGLELAGALHQQLTDPAVVWHLVRHDAETVGAVLSPAARPEIEVVFRHLLEVRTELAERLALGSAVSTEELGATLTYHPQLLCASPALGVGDPTSSGQRDIAVIIDHHDGVVELDIDGDLKPDFSAPASPHTIEHLEVGRTVLIELRRDGSGVHLRGAAYRSGQLSAGLPAIVETQEDGTARRLADGRTGKLHPLDGLAHQPYHSTQRVLAFQFADGSFQALSTPLRHLKAPDT
jgi:hypothetical protein